MITGIDKAVWIAALRSGDYKRGKGRLKKKLKGKDSFCCLGVLHDIHGEWGDSITSVVGYKSYAPKGIFKYGYLSRGTSRGLDTHTQHILASMNDRGKTFNQIADYIENNVPSTYPMPLSFEDDFLLTESPAVTES